MAVGDPLKIIQPYLLAWDHQLLTNPLFTHQQYLGLIDDLMKVSGAAGSLLAAAGPSAVNRWYDEKGFSTSAGEADHGGSLHDPGSRRLPWGPCKRSRMSKC
jgi:hypothetical protein